MIVTPPEPVILPARPKGTEAELIVSGLAGVVVMSTLVTKLGV